MQILLYADTALCQYCSMQTRIFDLAILRYLMATWLVWLLLYHPRLSTQYFCWLGLLFFDYYLFVDVALTFGVWRAKS